VVAKENAMRTLRRTFKLAAPMAGFAALLAICGPLQAAPAPATPPAAAPTVPPGAPATPAPTPGAPTPAPGDSAARARAAAVAAKANVDVGEAWTRATPGNATTAAIYVKIASNKDADRLVSVEAAAAQTAEIHDEATQNGVVKMAAIPALDIPAGSTVNLAPGGRHVMLTGLKAPLKEGESFVMTFTFDKAGKESTAVKVLAASATGLPPVGSTRRGDTTAGVSGGVSTAK
jgi:copper(I)-binding protein